jgi:hypothetical protein
MASDKTDHRPIGLQLKALYVLMRRVVKQKSFDIAMKKGLSRQKGQIGAAIG